LPIELEKYYSIKERKEKSDRELLKFFKKDNRYSTTDVQEFLGVNNAATLGRLKKLKKAGYLGLKIERRVYNWFKIKDIKEDQIVDGWLFN
jgi:DNA-binding Lrp family transcriptional regulator